MPPMIEGVVALEGDAPFEVAVGESQEGKKLLVVVFARLRSVG